MKTGQIRGIFAGGREKGSQIERHYEQRKGENQWKRRGSEGKREKEKEFR